MIARPQLGPAPSVRDRVSEAEWRARVELAAAYRMLDHLGVRDLTYNHLSARVPDQPNALLVKPSDWMFGEVTASCLWKYDLDGNPLLNADKPLAGGNKVIHAGLLRLRPDLGAVFHTHTPANVAVSAQPHGLLPISQQAMLFYNRIARHDFGGFEFEAGMEAALARDLGPHQAALLSNHGVLVVASNVPEAVVIHHFLEFACQAQVGALTGGPPVIPPSDVCEKAARTMEQIGAVRNGGKNWAACLRLVERLYPDYRT